MTGKEIGNILHGAVRQHCAITSQSEYAIIRTLINRWDDFGTVVFKNKVGTNKLVFNSHLESVVTVSENSIIKE